MAERYPSLPDLGALALVAELGSIGAAAERLGTAQPALSRRMAALERACGAALLRRGPRGSALTPQGEVVLGWAEPLLAESRRFTDAVATLRDDAGGTVRVGASMTIAEHLVPGWLARAATGPAPVSVVLVVRNSTDVLAAVEAGEVDLGFVETPSVPPSTGSRRVGWDEVVVAVTPTHPWARLRSTLDVRRLAGEPLLVREPGSGTRATLDDALRAHGLTPSVAMELSSNAALASAAVEGIAPVVLSGRALAGGLAAGRLVRVDVEGLGLRRPLTAVWVRGRRPGAAVRRLLRVATG